jgi:hypothetical protein
MALLAGDHNFFARPDFPGAVVSALHHDPAPLLRLVARARVNGRGYEPRYRSSATAAAATCEEVRFPWAWNASPAERAEAARQAETGINPAAADPFDPATLAASAPMRLCARWPTASAGPPPEPGPMPDVPVLLLEDASHVGSSVEAATRAAARFQHARLLVTKLAPLDDCAERAVRRFMRGQTVQDRCPRARPLIPAARPAPRSLRDVRAHPRVPGRRGRLLNAFGVTFGDLVDDFYARYFGSPQAFRAGGKLRGGGLRDGSFVSGEDILRMTRYSYVPGVRLTGRWNESRHAIPLRIDGPGRLDGRIRVFETSDYPIFRVRGRIAGRRVDTRIHVRSRLLEAIEVEFGESSARAPALPLLP